LCNIDSNGVIARSTPLLESRQHVIISTVTAYYFFHDLGCPDDLITIRGGKIVGMAGN